MSNKNSGETYTPAQNDNISKIADMITADGAVQFTDTVATASSYDLSISGGKIVLTDQDGGVTSVTPS